MHPDRDVDPPPSRSPYLVLLGLVAFAVITALYFALQPPRDSRGVGTGHPAVGRRLDKLALEPMLNAEEWVTLDDLHGKATLINFWGPWCGYCIKEFPELLPLEKKYRGSKNAQILLVSYAHSRDPKEAEELRDDSAAALKRFKSDPPVYRDPEAQFIFQVMQTLKFEGFSFPTSILLDGSGKVRGVWTGYDPGYVGEMEAAIEKLAAEQRT